MVDIKSRELIKKKRDNMVDIKSQKPWIKYSFFLSNGDGHGHRLKKINQPKSLLNH